MSLHSTRIAESRTAPGNQAAPSTSRTIRTGRPNAENHTTRLPQRASITSNSSSGRRSSGSMDSSIRSAPPTRPSALPRSTSASSQSKLPLANASKLTVAASAKAQVSQAPVPATSSKTFPAVDTANVLTHRDPNVNYAIQTLSPLEMSEDGTWRTENQRKRRSRISLGSAAPSAAPLPPRLIPELQALAAVSNRPIPPPPSSSISTISSPSTQFTTSPSPWSASTAATTPVSWSSASPSIIQPTSTQLSAKRSQTVPVPNVPRNKLVKLPALKESHQPSNSSSRTNLGEDHKTVRRKEAKSPLNTPSSTPPKTLPRSSSFKSSRSRSDSKNSTQGDFDLKKLPRAPKIADEKPPTKKSGSHSKDGNQDSNLVRANQGHSKLQNAINLIPSRPSRDGKDTIGTRSAEPVNTNILYNGTRKQLLDSAPIGRPVYRKTSSRDETGKKADVEKSTEKQSARSRLAKFSRLAIFGRSRETTSADADLNKAPRKGPAAGTGHEGYGRFGRRTRKSSTESNSNVAVTDSDTSAASASVTRQHQRNDSGKSSRRASSTQSSLDEFASTRMKPSVLVGGSQKVLHVANVGPAVPPKTDEMSAAPLKPTSRSNSNDPPQADRHFTNAAPVQERSLAQRRSQKFADADEPFHLPEPIATENLIAQPYIDSQNTIYSDISVSGPVSGSGTDVHRTDPYLREKQRKKGRKLKWNPFGRKEETSSEPEYQEPVIQHPREPEMPVSVSAGPVVRQMPYYAMLGSEQEITTTEAIGIYLNEAAQSPQSTDDGVSERSQEVSPVVTRKVDSTLLPSAPQRNDTSPVRPEDIIRPSAPVPTTPVDSPYDSEFDFPLPPTTKVSPSAEEQTSKDTDVPKQRQPRLAQVGRIPKVVSRGQRLVDDQRKDRAEPMQQFDFGLGIGRSVNTNIREETRNKLMNQAAKPKSEEKRSLVLDTVPEVETDTEPTRPAIPGQTLPASTFEDDFLRFSDSRSSGFTTSSSSDGMVPITAPALAMAAPLLRQHQHSEHEDEIWNEYDDFIDHVMSSHNLRSSTKPWPGSTDAYNILTSGPGMGKGKGLAIFPPPLLTQQKYVPDLLTPPYVYSSSPSLQEMASSEEIRLRRSRIAAALHSSYTSFDPSSPFSMRDFIAEYARRDSLKPSERLSNSSTGLQSPNLSAIQEQSPEQEQTKHCEHAAHIDDIERTRNPAKHSELSFSSLMVSRWLSFGRVLFSPAHAEIESQPERHVLVIDGLGNEDWSIYCAVTYQTEKAYVHDLKERRSTPRSPQTVRKSDGVPSNHRRAEVSSFNDRFPFPPSFFSVIVLRFPPVMADSKFQNIVSECKRVLAPGGYLELMVLELDINNMGVLTRRAVKDLKIKMSMADRGVSLKPVIDNVQTVLGSRGFPNLSKCVVGVPVVGRPVSSAGSTSSSHSSGGSTKKSPAGPRPFESLSNQAGFSLNDLVADHSENADAKIGRMVSRTARSWWQHCFEAFVISDGNLGKSVFAQKPIMNECKSRASNFKLLIAYTQKPGTDQKRRTLSEPTMPTLAIAGLSKPVKTAK